MLRPATPIPYHVTAILAAHWLQLVAQYKRWIRPVVVENVRKVLACRIPLLGCHIYQCKGCGHLELIPHSCKSRFCPTCGKRWIETDPKFLVYHGGQKKRWKYQVTIRMKRAHREGQWRFPKSKDFLTQYPCALKSFSTSKSDNHLSGNAMLAAKGGVSQVIIRTFMDK